MDAINEFLDIIGAEVDYRIPTTTDIGVISSLDPIEVVVAGMTFKRNQILLSEIVKKLNIDGVRVVGGDSAHLVKLSGFKKGDEVLVKMLHDKLIIICKVVDM